MAGAFAAARPAVRSPAGAPRLDAPGLDLLAHGGHLGQVGARLRGEQAAQVRRFPDPARHRPIARSGSAAKRRRIVAIRLVWSKVWWETARGTRGPTSSAGTRTPSVA